MKTKSKGLKATSLILIFLTMTLGIPTALSQDAACPICGEDYHQNQLVFPPDWNEEYWSGAICPGTDSDYQNITCQ